MNDWIFLFSSINAVVSKWKNYGKLYHKKIPFKKKNFLQCNVSIPASIVDFYDSILNPICKKWFSFSHAG